jgi:NAD(P)-dependent dehydrogenase (short-subunit alcohol dehydrogenase family)
MVNMSNLTGKVAIVTGASKGIGSGIARALASAVRAWQ